MWPCAKATFQRTSGRVSLHPVLVEKLNASLEAVPPPSSTPRDAVLPPISGKVHAVVGMRRTGKSTFLQQLCAQSKAQTSAASAVYLSFDDDRLAELDVGQLGALLDEHYRRAPEMRTKTVVRWYLDEVQLVPGWERFVRRVVDTEKVEIVVSGSSAKMLSREVHTSLRGRGIETVIRPFGFREFLRHRGEEPSRPPRRWTAAERSKVEKRFREFLDVGGFPEAQLLPKATRHQLLQGYVDTVLFRDVVERYGVTQVAALRWIVRHTLRNPAGAFSVHRFAQDLKAQGLGVSRESVHELLGHLIDAFLLSPVAIATDSERRRNSNPRKLYPADPGLIPAFDASGRSQIGHALETAVLNELERRGATASYVRTDEGFEVDFLAQSPVAPPTLIQVCADVAAPETLHRELRALEAAELLRPDARRLLLTLNRDAPVRGLPSGVSALPAYEWILAPDEAD
jgi:predicted AAA+ superfamily ATPase